MFKKNMQVMRFKCELEENLSAEEFFLNIDFMKFKSVLGEANTVGFVDPEDRYDESKNLTNAVPFHEGWCIGAFRIDTVPVPSEVVKRRFIEAVEKEKELTGKKFVSRDRRKELTEAIKYELLKTIPAKAKFVPFFYDLDSNVGYLFSTSTTVFDKFSDLFCRVVGGEVKPMPPCDYIDEVQFLTYLWWDTESNSAREHVVDGNTVSTYFLDKVSVISSTDRHTVTATGDTEEGRIAVSKGGFVTKAAVGFTSRKEDQDSVDRVCVLNRHGCFDSMQFTTNELSSSVDSSDDDTAKNIIILGIVEFMFKIMDSWVKIYTEVKDTNAALTPAIQATWGRGDFCSRAYEDI